MWVSVRGRGCRTPTPSFIPDCIMWITVSISGRGCSTHTSSFIDCIMWFSVSGRGCRTPTPSFIPDCIMWFSVCGRGCIALLLPAFIPDCIMWVSVCGRGHSIALLLLFYTSLHNEGQCLCERWYSTPKSYSLVLYWIIFGQCLWESACSVFMY